LEIASEAAEDLSAVDSNEAAMLRIVEFIEVSIEYSEGSKDARVYGLARKQ
jgi:hypothetical protein